ncbi:transglycosylase domain-containing protein [Lactococcus fujiensis]|uniref:Penicillin-binding protein 1b n=1 Tax=Lactococcus fujiensis JCM 16395 TaxID=1291764 RepID=A0A2A5RKQ8_9LACT|nr:transglycosylase domain-containing protein [Lactococcus fujiensis]PCR99762.1 Penicillin-binding protein 1b [Lactococcus fujiensis JCM 16395]
MKKDNPGSQDKMRRRLEHKVQTKRENSNDGKQKNNDLKRTLSTTFTVIRGLLIVFGVVLILGGTFGAAAGIGYFARLIEKTDTPNRAKMLAEINDIHGVSSLKYSNGQTISDISSDLVRVSVDSNSISQNVKNALIATEDDTFETNAGVVPKAVVRGIIGSVGGGTTSGGSTLTQQLIKQQILGDSVTFQRKASEIVYARALTKYLSKDEILTDYLNVSPFGRNNKGQNIAGVQAAAQGIFGKSAKDLTVPEAAFIAGLPQSPIVYSPYASDGSLKSKANLSYGINRQKIVLFNLYRNDYISKADYDKYVAYDISKEFLQPAAASEKSHGYLYNVVYNQAVEEIYNYLVKKDNVSATDLGNDSTKAAYKAQAEQDLQNKGYTVKTTINQAVYNAMQNAVANYGSVLQDGTGTVQPGNVLMDNSTGAVLGFVGGLDYSTNQFNHAFSGGRSPGSSIKPLIAYGPAIDMGLMGSATILSNYPAKYSTGQDIEHVGSKGTKMMTFTEALDVSYNIPAFWTYQAVLKKDQGAKPYMTKMGYNISNYSIESLPLGGGVDPTVVQHTNGYATMANGGKYVPYYIIQSITDDQGNVIYQHSNPTPVQVYSEATSTIMESMLQGAIKAQKTSKFYSDLQSLNPTLASNVAWAGKTGTTDNYTDVWLMLSTPTVTLGGWAGHDDNSAMTSNAGYINNASYMANLVNAINAADPTVFGSGKQFKDPSTDPNVTKSTVLESTGEKPGKVNGKDITGKTVTSFWATKAGAPTTTYKFAIGGSDANYVDAWSSILPSMTASDTSSATTGSSSGSSSKSSSSTSSSSSN